MTIKDIAKIAGVSVSSVSKIINGKDASISPATREKVLGVVKEYHYTPYAFVESGSRSYLIGALLREDAAGHELAAQLCAAADARGYHVVPSGWDGSDAGAARQLAAFVRLNADAVLAEGVSPALLADSGVKAPVLDIAQAGGVLSLADLYARMARMAVDRLAGLRHRHIACIVADDRQGAAFAAAFRQALYDRQLPCRDEDVLLCSADASLGAFPFLNYTAVVCSGSRVAAQVCREVRARNLLVPIDLSILYAACAEMLSPPPAELASVSYSLAEYAGLLMDRLIAETEKVPLQKPNAACTVRENAGSSLAAPRLRKAPGIVAVGAMNIDLYLLLEDFPRDGYSVSARPLHRMPGGKAVNQAITAARLGANACVIGKIGSDDSGRLIYKTITDVTRQNLGVLVDFEAETGAAYVLTKQNGESSVMLFVGANEHLTPEDLRAKEELFCDMQFCLIQTEMGTPLAQAAASLARKHHCRTILKPCSVPALPDALLALTDYLVPNAEELARLVPAGGTMEEKVAILRRTFRGTVVVTCAEKGCYVCAPDDAFFCSALNVEASDVIGASDVFIGTLACFLGEGAALRDAVRSATYAAGYAVTVQGATTASIDRQVLSALMSDSGYQVELTDAPRG